MCTVSPLVPSLPPPVTFICRSVHLPIHATVFIPLLLIMCFSGALFPPPPPFLSPLSPCHCSCSILSSMWKMTPTPTTPPPVVLTRCLSLEKTPVPSSSATLSSHPPMLSSPPPPPPPSPLPPSPPSPLSPPLSAPPLLLSPLTPFPLTPPPLLPSPLSPPVSPDPAPWRGLHWLPDQVVQSLPHPPSPLRGNPRPVPRGRGG